ncbi:MAG: O-antigen ligase family protein [Bacteroidales bacterium]|jgi:O-antigen ligase|nr:O-antigen ligase family protein [Bacteroidales bacterium]
MRSLNWHSIALCILISGLFLSFVLKTFFVQTLLLWLLGGFAIYTGIRTRKFYFQWYSVFFLAMFLLRILALWRQPELKFSNIEISLSFILFPLIFSLVKVDEKMWAIIQKAVVIGFATFLCVILYNFIIHIYFENLVKEVFANAKGYYWMFLKSPFYNHPSFLSVILAPSIPMCFNLAAKAAKNWQQWLWLLFIPLLVFIVFVSGSRIGLFICGALIVLSCIYFFKKLNIISKIALSLAFVAAIGVFRISTINYTEDPIRKEMNAFVIEKIKERPLFGYGYGTQNVQLNNVENLSEFNNPAIYTMAHFHNTYLDDFFQFGFIGISLLVSLLLYLIYWFIKKHNIFLLSFLMIYIPFFYVELPFNVMKGIMPMMLFLAVIMNIQRMQNTEKKKHNKDG